jgi:hypothetical protein
MMFASQHGGCPSTQEETLEINSSMGLVRLTGRMSSYEQNLSCERAFKNIRSLANGGLL